MSDDIVARLRNCLCIPDCLCGKAADEIERLHRDYSCICSMMRRMMEERDEARREILESLHPDDRQAYAEARGWDCYKEAADGR